MPDESTTPVMPPVASPVSFDDASTPASDSSALGMDAPVSDGEDLGGLDTSPVTPTATPVDDKLSISPVVVAPTPVVDKPAEAVVNSDIPAEVAHKIGESHNVLIALSSDPSVDELAAAIGLSIYLDRLGKRATAIYSGSTPNALEFLKPEETFESSADTLQDFVIALNKDKADHLRYKLDGDYVKIYITPYRHRLSEEDLEYSYGDYNVDLVLALDVANGIDLDAALREHGRIMHDAVIINITTGNPGKFGEIEWSDKTASSVSEMVAQLLYSTNSKVKIEKEEATAFLTGIVAATNRFSNAGTTPNTMKLASRLMESGANQQLISKNITPDIDNEMFALGSSANNELGVEKNDGDSTKLDIKHGNEEGVDESKEVSDTITEKESTLLDDLKAAEASLAGAGAETTPDLSNRPIKLDELKDDVSDGGSGESAGVAEASEPTESAKGGEPDDSVEVAEPVAPADSITSVEPVGQSEATESAVDTSTTSGPTLPEVAEPAVSDAGGINSDKPEKVIAPSSDFSADLTDEGADKYSKMLEDALADAGGGTGDVTAPIVSSNVEAMPTDASVGVLPNNPVDTFGGSAMVGNPAAMSAPEVPVNPEINGVPSINYMPMPGEEVLPPPPAPPIDMSTPDESTMPIESGVSVGVGAPVGSEVSQSSGISQPSAVAQDPSAFRIPGM